ncbi:tetratricopeptide repeat protein [Rhodocaloribacter sp.]
MSTVTPKQLADWYRTALAHHREGRYARAREGYRQVLAHAPGHPGAMHLLGVLAHQEGAHEEAVTRIREAIRRKPGAASYHNNLGNALAALGRVEEAEAAYREALRLEPDYAGALYNLGNLYRRTGAHEEAERMLRDALRLRPDYLDATLALAGLMQDLGRFTEADVLFRDALRRHPDEALIPFERGNLLRLQGRHDEALACYRAAIRLDPNMAGAYNNLGAVLQLRGEVDAAVAVLRRSLALRPDSAEAHFNLGQLYEGKNRLDEAAASYERALALDPDFGGQVFFHLSYLRRKLCDWRDYDARVEALMRRTEAHLRENDRVGLPPLTLNVFSVPAALRTAVARHQARLIERRTAELRKRNAFVHTRERPERLRIGYVSPDFRRHAVGTLTHRMFEHHDRDAFEVYAYALVHLDDDFNRAVRAGVDVYADCSRLSYAQTARRIHTDGIHILVDLAGYTTYSRTPIFALRPAPVQAHYLGYLDTMGADFLPYMIADRFSVTEEMTEAYDEALVYMPDTFAVASPLPVSEKPMTRAQFGVPEDAFVFCCFNSLHKLDPACFDVWMRILRRVPEGVLWLYASGSATTEANLRREAGARGVAPERLIFAGKLPVDEYLARYRLADLFLDTFAYNAGATAVGALWAGLPVLTMPGRTFFSRMGGSLCRAAGLPEAVCASEAEYEERAVALAADPAALAGLRRKLAERRSEAPLFDTARFVRHLEAAYRRMWEDYVTGVGPRDVEVAAS